MNKIWSDNKYVNLMINVLLFLTGINFLHIGQLILPIICFILFVDNKLQFKVNNVKTFIILCLFAISFYGFSYKLGFYSVMGFACPMAYYIGSNMKYNNENNIKKIVYLFALSMGLHVILNAIIEYILHGHHGFFMSTTHYDFWTREKIANTATAINADLIIGSLYYLLFHEKNKNVRLVGLIVFVLSMFYLVVIGRRTPVIMIAFVFALSYLYQKYKLKNLSKKVQKNLYYIILSSVLFVLIIIVVYSLNIFNARTLLSEYHIIHKFSKGFINDQRFELYFGSFPLMPKYLWGGQHISTILTEQVHDLWIDVYDYAGIITCALLIVYSVIYAKNIYRFLKNNKINSDFRLLMVGIFTVIVMQMFLEPVMTGASLYLLISIIIGALIERLNINNG